jgi:hypothetical protein
VPASDSIALVVTSIQPPTPAMRALAAGCVEHRYRFIVVGDAKSPEDFALPGAEFVSLEAQLESGLALARRGLTAHYARKNVGYLLAIRSGARQIWETDDDNLPVEGYWQLRQQRLAVPVAAGMGFVNAYRYFTSVQIWPRGFPLDAMTAECPDLEELPSRMIDCPVQQSLVDGDPDVDAIYRLLSPPPQSFAKDRRLATSQGSWCPFNSQNTTWFPDAYPLMYLPSYCSVRMTDIWRSYVAQAIAWANGWGVLFHSPTMRQERNAHNLMKDFEDEVPGYLNNRRLVAALDELPIAAGREAIPNNLLRCYRALVDLRLVDERELGLVDTWLGDLRSIQQRG